MNTPLFKISKNVLYSEMENELEDYIIIMNSKEVMTCMRNELEELQSLITLALNDRKEEKHGE